MVMSISFLCCGPVFSSGGESLIDATPAVKIYAEKTVKPLLPSNAGHGKLAMLLAVSRILLDEENGIAVNKIEPNDFFIYDKLEGVKLGFIYRLNFSAEKNAILKRWRSRFMSESPADLFFAPSANEIIRSKAAFGCTHYARAFIAVVKSLGMIDNPRDLRYVISCVAEDYNEALDKNDYDMTINGHQFVLVKIGSRWHAVNTSRAESVKMPPGFSPETCRPSENIPVSFESYPDIEFLLRKIGTDYNDDCGDRSLTALMNISRSGRPDLKAFLWEKYTQGSHEKAE